MTSALHLMHGRLQTNLFREEARQKLVALLGQFAGSKAIIWDERLTGPFGLVAEYSFLREHDVVRMTSLRPGRLPQAATAPEVDLVLFLVRPELALMEMVADNVQSEEEQGGKRKQLVLCLVPAGSDACQRVLEERHVLRRLHLTSLQVRLLPLDADLVSMERPTAFRELALEGDHGCLFEAAQALLSIQLKFGLIGSVCGQGPAAKQVYDYMTRLRRERRDEEFPAESEIDTLLLLDRRVDLVTPLATQLTYEGLIDEIFGISNNTVKLPSEKFAPKQEGGPIEMQGERKHFVLTSAEELYTAIRDKNFSAIGPALSKKAKQISAQYEERHSQSVSEMKNFVKNILPSIKAAKESLGLHTSIAELIKERTDSEAFMEALQVEQEMTNSINTDRAHPHIEQLIAKKADLTKVLRLLCLQSACSSGLRPRLLDQYRRDLLQTYGFQHATTLANLERAGLLRPHARPVYPQLRRELRLSVDDVNEQAPSDIAYTFSGYAPLSVRLAQSLARPGWRSVADALSLLPPPTLQEQQPLPRRHTPAAGDTRLTLVFFLGGVTFAEVAALRFLSSQEDAPTEYVVATTQMLNGNSLLDSLSDPLAAAV